MPSAVFYFEFKKKQKKNQSFSEFSRRGCSGLVVGLSFLFLFHTRQHVCGEKSTKRSDCGHWMCALDDHTESCFGCCGCSRDKPCVVSMFWGEKTWVQVLAKPSTKRKEAKREASVRETAAAVSGMYTDTPTSRSNSRDVARSGISGVGHCADSVRSGSNGRCGRGSVADWISLSTYRWGLQGLLLPILIPFVRMNGIAPTGISHCSPSLVSKASHQTTNRRGPGTIQ